jgi:hypothetical protein
MLRRSAAFVILYLLGLLLVWGWSLSHLFGGTATRDNLALVLVLPLAWTFSYWPMVGSLLAAWKVWRLQKTLETWAERKAVGLPTELPEQEIEDVLTRLMAEENHIPERWARRLVRKLIGVARERIAREGVAVEAPQQRA